MAGWTAEKLARVLRGDAPGPWEVVAASTSAHRAAVEAGLHALALRADGERTVALTPAEIRAAGRDLRKPETWELDGAPAPGGLFCADVFGPVGDPARATTPGRIDLPEPVPHPLAPGATLESVPVLPADLRPFAHGDDGEPRDLTDGYRRLLNRRNRMARLVELDAPEMVVTNERRLLREAVDELLTGAVLGFVAARLDALEADDALDAALATLREDEGPARAVAELALRALGSDRLVEELTHTRLDEVGDAWGASRRRQLRDVLKAALFDVVPPGHPAYARVAAARVDALSAAGDLAGAHALAVGTGDDPLRIAVLAAELGAGTADLEREAAGSDARAWIACTALAMHHLRALAVAPAMAAFHRAARLRAPSRFRREVQLPPLPQLSGTPAHEVVGEIASCLRLNGLLSCSTLSGFLRLSREVGAGGPLLREQALALVRRAAASRSEAACDEMRELGRYLTESDAHPEAVAALEAALDGWPPGGDRDLLENALALACGRVGRTADAVALLRGLHERAGTPEDAVTLGCNLGIALVEAGRADEALPLLRGLAPPPGPSARQVARALGSTCLHLGDPAGARAVVEPVVAALGPRELATRDGAALVDLLLRAQLDLGDPAAEAVQRRLLAAVAARGQGPPVWLEEANLGDVLVSLGRPGEGILLLEGALGHQEEAFGATSSSALQIRRMLIRALRAAGDEDAAATLERPLPDLEAVEVRWEPIRLPGL